MEQLGRALLHASRGLERPTDQSPLHILDDLLERDPVRGHVEVRQLERVGRPHGVRNHLGADLSAGREHDGALDDVLELPHVARVVVVLEQLERFGHQLEVRLVVLVTVLLEEMLHQERNIFPSLP